MTDPNKAAVLAKFPNAYAWMNERGVWVISTAPARYTSAIATAGYTEPEAWADAARRLK